MTRRRRLRRIEEMLGDLLEAHEAQNRILREITMLAAKRCDDPPLRRTSVAAIVDPENCDELQIRKTAQWVLKKLSPQGWTNSGELRRAGPRHRPYLAEALKRLEESGRVKAEHFEYHGQPTRRYRRCADVERYGDDDLLGAAE